MARHPIPLVEGHRSISFVNAAGSTLKFTRAHFARAILNTAVEDGLIVANPCTIKGASVEPG